MRTPASSESASARPWTTGILLVALALALRLLFWQATADAAWPYSAWYKGDAATWLEWAQAIEASRPFEVGLPIRPPGAAYLIAAISDGETAGIPVLKAIWCLLGALTVGLLYAAVLRALGSGLATGVGLLCAASTGLMILATSLNNETPYLALLAAILALWEPVRRRQGALLLALWSLLNGTACLVRAEHLLYFLLLLAYLVPTWSTARQAAGWRSALGSLSLALAVFTLVLIPWHASAWSAIARFNTQPLTADPATEDAQRRVEALLSSISWQPEALAELETLPVATRRTARLFITATEGVRGRTTVGAGSLQILDQAFGAIPRRLPSHPFIAVYGGLNFHLANHSRATGGFDRAPLERRPPLVGGPEQYPLALIRHLPPAQLTLTYPPHLEAVTDGYRLGWEWIREHPRDFVRLAGQKLRIFWHGAALGVGGYNLPLGLSGIRRRADMVAPEGGSVVVVWRAALLALVVAGAWIGHRQPALFPWLAFLLSKLLITLAFFGYARQGASVIPVVMLLMCLAGNRLLTAVGDAWRRLPQRRRRWLVAAPAILLLLVEAGRWASRPEVTIDGRAIGASDPFPTADHRDRRIELR